MESEGLVKTETEGQRKYFSLTDKGLKEANNLGIIKVKELLKTLEKICSFTASNPEKLRKYVNSETEKIEKTTFLKKVENIQALSDEVKTQIFQEAMVEYTQRNNALILPIKDALRSIHKIHSAMLGNGDAEGSVTLISGQVAMLIDKKRFEGIPFALLYAMPISEAMRAIMNQNRQK
jgi:hypothetical protein